MSNNEHHKKQGVNSEGQVIPAPLVGPVVILFLLYTGFVQVLEILEST
jgi:hypothetical protein